MDIIYKSVPKYELEDAGSAFENERKESRAADREPIMQHYVKHEKFLNRNKS